MAAHEEQPEEVVAVVRLVELLGEGSLRVAQVGKRLFSRQLALPIAPPNTIERGVAPDQDEPRHGVPRRAVLRPALERAQARLLERLLGQVQVPEMAEQRAHRLGTRAPEGHVDPGEGAHGRGASGRSRRSGTDFVGAVRAAGLAEVLRRGDRLLERRALDDEEAEELLLGLRERPVEDDCLLALAKGRRGRRRHQAGDRPQASLAGEPVGHDIELGDDGGILLRRPGLDDVFAVVTEDGVLHSRGSPS